MVVSGSRTGQQIRWPRTGCRNRALLHRARFYDPQLGRFISEDPIGLEGGVNPYVYAENDPINLSDPSGQIPMCLAGAAGALAAWAITERIEYNRGTRRSMGDYLLRGGAAAGFGLITCGIGNKVRAVAMARRAASIVRTGGRVQTLGAASTVTTTATDLGLGVVGGVGPWYVDQQTDQRAYTFANEPGRHTYLNSWNEFTMPSGCRFDNTVTMANPETREVRCSDGSRFWLTVNAM